MRILITGSAGFIGCNLARAWIGEGHNIIVYDDLSRPGSQYNLEWLRSFAGDALQVIYGDVRDAAAVTMAVREVDVVVHLAGQVAVTTSVKNPREDFEINALGTFNMLEAARNAPTPPIFIYASTNKVYGSMDDVAIVEEPTHYCFRDLPNGVSESQPLDFHSPYACSKGVGDQYVRDYARIYGLRTVVFRQSCCYGMRQFGVEDQGWVAHFIIAAQLDRPISIYGNGRQVRDLLYIDDLIAAYTMALEHIHVAAGKVYNVGGGQANSLSVWAEFQPILSRLAGRTITPASYYPWRLGDQLVFVSDNTRIERDLGWRPRVGFEEGIGRLWEWVSDNRALFGAGA